MRQAHVPSVVSRHSRCAKLRVQLPSTSEIQRARVQAAAVAASGPSCAVRSEHNLHRVASVVSNRPRRRCHEHDGLRLPFLRGRPHHADSRRDLAAFTGPLSCFRRGFRLVLGEATPAVSSLRHRRANPVCAFRFVASLQRLIAALSQTRTFYSGLVQTAASRPKRT